MELAGLLIAIIALIISIMALPTAFQMLWGGPQIKIDFSELDWPDEKRLICQISSAPIRNAILRRLGVRRESAVISGEFSIFETGTNRVIVDTARAQLFDIADDAPRGNIRATLVDYMPLFFTCLIHIRDGRVVSRGGLSGQTVTDVPVGRYFVAVRVTCGHTKFSMTREMMVGTSPVFTAWLG